MPMHEGDGRRHNGRPPKLTLRQMQLLETTLEEAQGAMSSTEILKILKFDVSARTIRRAKRAIMDKRCQQRRNSIIQAARSLAAAAAAASSAGSQSPFTSATSSAPQSPSKIKLMKGPRRRDAGVVDEGDVIVVQ